MRWQCVRGDLYRDGVMSDAETNKNAANIIRTRTTENWMGKQKFNINDGIMMKIIIPGRWRFIYLIFLRQVFSTIKIWFQYSYSEAVSAL